MFYEPDKDDHGLPYDPYKSIVVPRPIGWISTISRDGIVNLAPFSQFNNLSYDPPFVMFAAIRFPDRPSQGQRQERHRHRRIRRQHGDLRIARGGQYHLAVRAAGRRRGQARGAGNDSVSARETAAG